MQYLPINLNLSEQIVVVVGGGTVASRKIKNLIQVGAQVICMAKQPSNEIEAWNEQDKIKFIQHDLNDTAVLDAINNIKMIISATDDAEVSQQVYNYAIGNNLLINTVDQQELCNFITPAIVDRSPVVVSISTEGSAPILARIIKQKIEYLLPRNMGWITRAARQLRRSIKQSIPTMKGRRQFWEKYFQWSHRSPSIMPNEFTVPDSSQVDQLIRQCQQPQGMVSLVGAGPGNPDLLTLKAIKVLQTADVVLHDQLISSEILAMIRKDAVIIDVGKQAGNHQTKQETINRLLVQHVQKGAHVCRLKGGDSFVFGRGGEEVIELHAHGIQFEVVPGITAAVGCAAFAGIPLTHRDHAQSLAFMTAHCSDSVDTIDWQFYAKKNQTLAVYMGLIKAEKLVQELIKHGKSADEYIAIIENGTLASQRTFCGHLYQLPAMIVDHQVKSPALIVIGSVAQYAQQLDWFKPLANSPAMVEQLNYLKTA